MRVTPSGRRSSFLWGASAEPAARAMPIGLPRRAAGGAREVAARLAYGRPSSFAAANRHPG